MRTLRVSRSSRSILSMLRSRNCGARRELLSSWKTSRTCGVATCARGVPSCPSHEVVGGFFFAEEAIRTESRRRCSAVAREVTMTCRRGDGVPADASPGLDAIDATLHTNHDRVRGHSELTEMLRAGDQPAVHDALRRGHGAVPEGTFANSCLVRYA